MPTVKKIEAYPGFAALRRRIFGAKKISNTGTDLVSVPSTSSARVNPWVAGRRLYTGVAIGTALITFVGFAQTCCLKVLFGKAPLRLLLHVHGLVMTAWILLFFVQMRLVAVHCTDLHRRLGVAGAALAGLVLVIGTMVALSQGYLHLIANDEPIEPPLVLPPVTLGILLLFGTFATAAILNCPACLLIGASSIGAASGIPSSAIRFSETS